MVILALSTKADTMTFRKVPPRTSKVKGGFYPLLEVTRTEGNEAGDMYIKPLEKTGISVYNRA